LEFNSVKISFFRRFTQISFLSFQQSAKICAICGFKTSVAAELHWAICGFDHYGTATASIWTGDSP
jgi:hypothetical protein